MNPLVMLHDIFGKYFEGESIVIWGAGERGHKLLHYFNQLNLEVFAFCDSNPEKWNTKIMGVPCVEPEKLRSLKNCCIIFSPCNLPDEFLEIQKKYENFGRFIDGECLYKIISALPYFLGYTDFFPVGHFYSLYPTLEDAAHVESHSDDEIDFYESEQVELQKKLACYSHDLAAWNDDKNKYRFSFSNDAFHPGDATLLHSMLRHLQPKRVMEVGSGWSSAMALDTNEYYLDKSIQFTFIEPYPALLHSLLKQDDQYEIIPSKLQDVPLEKFQALDAGDILFIDSTHVSKAGSDVNYIIFHILPSLKPGVYIHFHDIFYPMEYPMVWLKKGVVWNEIYVLRAFLMNNSNYKVIYSQSMMEKTHPELFPTDWKLHPLDNSFWIQKLK